MKFLLIACFVALAAADVSHVLKSGEANAQIVVQELDVSPESYAYRFETDNGIKAEEQGQVQGKDDQAAINVQGSNSWSSPEGQKIETSYIANENGYQPQGSHLPTPPPIPAAILRSLEYIRANPPKDEKN